MKGPRLFRELSDSDIVILGAELPAPPGLYSAISSSSTAPVNPGRFVVPASPGVRRQALLLLA